MSNAPVRLTKLEAAMAAIGMTQVQLKQVQDRIIDTESLFE